MRGALPQSVRFAPLSGQLRRRRRSVSEGEALGYLISNQGTSAAGFHLPSGPAKPSGSGTGIPVRFGRKPVGTPGRIQI